MMGWKEMKFILLKFSMSWLFFFLFADKKKFPMILTTCYLAVILALFTDLLSITYPLWEYPSSTKVEFLIKRAMNAFGVYFVVCYFIIQTLPKRQNFFSILKHFFWWANLSILIEWIALKVGFIKHGLWWNLGYSYASDYLLFTIFYFHHRWIKRLIGNTLSADLKK